MGKITLFENCDVASYKYGWELHKYRPKGKAPKHMESKVTGGLACDESYHSTFENACVAALQTGMEGCETMEEALAVMNQHKVDIINAVRGIDKATIV